MKTPLLTLSLLTVMLCLNAQHINLDHFQVNIENEATINTKHSEFGMVQANGEKWMFTSDRARFGDRHEVIDQTFKMYTCNIDTKVRTVRPLDVNYRSDQNSGPATPVKNNAFYFTSTNKKATLNWKEGTKTNTLTISKAVLVEGKWKTEVIKEFKSKEYSFGQPSISKDGKTLFFVSNKEGGQGHSDIYVSYLRDGEWTEPVNLGAEVNTDQRDMYPYIHESGVLFFASNGHGGFGGLDLYMTYPTVDGWSTPENLGNPFNTPADDFSLYLDRDMKMGFMASNRDGGMGGDDIYRININMMTASNDEPSTKQKVKSVPVVTAELTEIEDEELAMPATVAARR